LVDLGRIVNNVPTATPLNDLHNLYNISEVQRLQKEHPGEDNLIKGHRTKGHLGLTRGKHVIASDAFPGLHLYVTFIALGDAMLKVPYDLAKVLGMMWGSPIFPWDVDAWAQGKHTPPYISSTPSVMCFSIQEGDILVFASDGLRSSLTEQGLPEEEVPKMIVSLAGMDMLDREALSSCEKAIGHSFISSAHIDNVADGVIRNILFGLDDLRMAKETMATMDEVYNNLRDDMSLVVVNVVEHVF